MPAMRKIRLQSMRGLIAAAGLVALAAMAGCQSAIVPLRDAVPLAAQVPAPARLQGAAATMASTAPATAPAGAAALASQTQPNTQPDTQPETPAASAPAGTSATAPAVASNPNETVRLVYRPSYDQAFAAAEKLLTDMGFRIDRKDYRLGTISTLPRIAPQAVELWRLDQSSVAAALESTINHQRESVTISIRRVVGRPEFYAVGVQVLVERQSNPSEMIIGPVFPQGSGFGSYPLTLRSDYAEPGQSGPEWYLLGHEPSLEKKILDKLLQRI
jgi:hypothetical protein